MTSLDGSPYAFSLLNGRRTVRGRRRKAPSSIHQSVQRSPCIASDQSIRPATPALPEDLSRTGVGRAALSESVAWGECSATDAHTEVIKAAPTSIGIDGDTDDQCQMSTDHVHRSSDVTSGDEDDEDRGQCVTGSQYTTAMSESNSGVVSRVHLSTLPQLLPSGYVYREQPAIERPIPVKTLILSPTGTSVLYPRLHERPLSHAMALSNLYGSVPDGPPGSVIPDPSMSLFVSKMHPTGRPVTMFRLMGSDGSNLVGSHHAHAVLGPAAATMQSKPHFQHVGSSKMAGYMSVNQRPCVITHRLSQSTMPAQPVPDTSSAAVGSTMVPGQFKYFSRPIQQSRSGADDRHAQLTMTAASSGDCSAASQATNTAVTDVKLVEHEAHEFAYDSSGHQLHRCRMCARVFTVFGAFRSHVLAAHHRPKNQCAICGKHFSRSWLLKGHMRTHTGERPYRCPYVGCERAFADKSNLRSHLLIHTAEGKNYICPRCNRAFAQKRYLHKHRLEVCKY